MLLNRCTIVQTRLVFWTQVLSAEVTYRAATMDGSTTMMADNMESTTDSGSSAVTG